MFFLKAIVDFVSQPSVKPLVVDPVPAAAACVLPSTIAPPTAPVTPTERVVAGTTISNGAFRRAPMPSHLMGKPPARGKSSRRVRQYAREKEEMDAYERRALREEYGIIVHKDEDDSFVLAPETRVVLVDSSLDVKGEVDEVPMSHSRESSTDSMATIKPTRAVPATHDRLSSAPALATIAAAPDWTSRRSPRSPSTVRTSWPRPQQLQRGLQNARRSNSTRGR